MSSEPSPMSVHGCLLYPSQNVLNARREREEASRVEWEARLRVWLSAAVSWASAGYPFFDPPAPDGTPEGWRWDNWDAFDDEEALNVALVRTYGCDCKLPLLGWTMKHDSVDGWAPSTPRCRMCNTEAPHA